MKKSQNYIKKLYLTYSAVLMIILTVVFAASLLISYREQYDKNVEIQRQLAVNVQEQTSSSLKEMDRIINGLLFNNSFMEIMKKSTASSSITAYSDSVMEDFIALDAPLLSTYRIIAFNQHAYYTLTKTGENPAFIKEAAAGYPWKEALVQADGKKLILPPHPDSFDTEHLPVYSVARSVTDRKQTYGFIEVQNTYAQLEAYCTLTAASGSVILFSEDGSVICPSVFDSRQKVLFQNIFRTIAESGLPSGSLRLHKQQLSYSTSPYSGWTAAVYSPVSVFVPFGLEMIVLTAGAFLLLAGLSLLMIRIITKRMAAPLLELNEAISRVTLDHMSVELPVSSGIMEINSINQSFQIMLFQLREAIAKSVQARANEERANYLALQAQMNPHTLYNTINMIESVSYLHGDKEVSSLCIAFSQMLRYISDYTKKEYTIGDELAHLANYAALTRKRYEGKLTIEVSSDPGLDRRVIPKFTIQPLVENSVQHGFHSPITTLAVLVSTETVGEGWRLLVSDNGPGFSEEILERITAQFAGCDLCLQDHADIINTKIGNLGLANIYIRCRILYGNAFSMTVGNLPETSGGYVEILIKKEVTNDQYLSC